MKFVRILAASVIGLASVLSASPALAFNNSNSINQSIYQNNLNSYLWQMNNQIGLLGNNPALSAALQAQLLGQYQILIGLLSSASNMPYWVGQPFLTNGFWNSWQWGLNNNIPQQYLINWGWGSRGWWGWTR